MAQLCEHVDINPDCDACIDRLHAAILDIKDGAPRLLATMAAYIRRSED